MVKTHAQSYKHIIHTNTPNSLPRRTATTQGLARGISCQYKGAKLY